jgi:hypothetical protein
MQPVLRKKIRAIKQNSFPLLLSGWIALVFAERLVVDKLIWARVHNLAEALLDTAVIVVFLFSWALVLWSMILQKEQAGRFNRKLKSMIRQVYREKKFTRTIVLSLLLFLLVAIYESITQSTSIVHVLASWIYHILEFLESELLEPAAIILYLAMVYAILRILYSIRLSTEKVNNQVKEWIIGNFLIAVVWVVYVLIYYLSLWPHIAESSKAFFLFGFIKDSLIYAFLAACLVSGMYRLGLCVDSLSGLTKWMVLAIFAGAAFMIGLVALVLDFNFTDRIKTLGAFEYPDPSQQALIIGHVYVRDWLILLPLVVVVFVWLLRQVNLAAEREHRAH